MTDLLLALAHHFLVFSLAALLAAEVAILQPGLSRERLRLLGNIDTTYGVFAGGGYDLGGQLIAMTHRPTAVLVANETIGVGLYRRLFEDGLMPRRDLAIVCFGEEPTARFLQPTPTHYRGDFRGLGVRLGAALLAILPGYAAADGCQLVQGVWPMTLVPGESDETSPSLARSA